MMIEIGIFAVAGLLNTLNFHRRFGGRSESEMPFKIQGYMSAFLMGALVTGGIANLVYWLVS